MKRLGIVCELGVESVSRSISFYRGLGFRVIETVGEGDAAIWAEMEYQGSRIMFQERGELAHEIDGVSASPSAPGHVIVLRVAGIQTAERMHGDLTAQGLLNAEVKYTDYGTAEFPLTDPDGFILLIAGVPDTGE